MSSNSTRKTATPTKRRTTATQGTSTSSTSHRDDSDFPTGSLALPRGNSVVSQEDINRHFRETYERKMQELNLQLNLTSNSLHSAIEEGGIESTFMALAQAVGQQLNESTIDDVLAKGCDSDKYQLFGLLRQFYESSINVNPPPPVVQPPPQRVKQPLPPEAPYVLKTANGIPVVVPHSNPQQGAPHAFQQDRSINIGWNAGPSDGLNNDHEMALYCQRLGCMSYNFVNYPVAGMQRYTWKPVEGGVPPMINIPDLQLQNHLWSTYIYGQASPWIDCDSDKEWLAKMSAECLEQELSYAAYLGLRAISIELKRRNSPRLAKIVSKWLWTKNDNLGFWIFVPTNGIGKPLYKGDTRDTWGIWADFRHACGNYSIDRLQCGLRVTTEMAPEFEHCSHSLRWKGEPVAAFWYDTDVFMTEPTTSQACLSINHSRLLSELWFSSKQKVVVSSEFPVNSDRRPQYSRILRVIIASKMRVLEMHAQLTSTYVGVSDYVDTIQPPLQPLSENLSSGIYDTLEQDPVKYVKYQEALELAIEDLYDAHEHVVIYILGAGRGPLINTALTSAAKFADDDGSSKIRIVAVEKNPNAYQTLYFCNMRKWNQCVQLINSDMRDLKKYVDSGELLKPDIIVSELLGSFGDNELAPECIDGLTPILHPHTISIPQRYRNFVVPIQSLRLHQKIMETDPRGYTRCQNFRGRADPVPEEATQRHEYLIPEYNARDTKLYCFDQIYVACLRSYTPLAALKEVFSFSHPNFEQKSNNRKVVVHFTMDRDCEVMGFAGFFEVVLYKDVMMSITPTEQTEGLISWFPALIPLRTLQRCRDGEKVEFHMERKSDEGGVWYEWRIVKPLNGITYRSELQNKNGVNSYMSVSVYRLSNKPLMYKVLTRVAHVCHGRNLAAATSFSSSANSTSHPNVYFAGIQPTGVPHMGNYLGFIEQWIDIQENVESGTPLILSIVDLHAMTTGPAKPKKARSDIREMCAGLMACGVDHEETILFQQSDIIEHTLLTWFLSSLQTITKLQRMPQYKDKSQKFKNGQIPLGLINYPVLQAADVLLYKGTHVPVGEDQTQHLNLLTDLARNFNGFFETDYFPIPKQVTGKYARVKSLSNPEVKMSKSDPSSLSRLEISDSREMIIKKCRRALSDTDGDVTYDPVKRPGVANLLTLYAAFTKRSVESTVEEFRGHSVVALKDQLAEVLDERFEPVRQNYHSLLAHTARIDDVLDYGAERAVVIARKNMEEIKKIMGLK